MMLDAVSALGVRSLPVGPTGGVARPLAPAQGGAAVDGGSDFAAVLGSAITDFSNKLRQAEAVSIGGVKGTASMQDVVEHVMSAEQSLQAVIAVRDKVISAYQEISRMAI